MAVNLSKSTMASLEAGDLTILDGLTEFSVGAWVYHSGAVASDPHIFGRSNDTTDFIRLFYEIDGVTDPNVDNIPKIFMAVDSVQVRSEGGTNGMFTTDAWHHVLATCKFNDASGLKLYFDGAPTGTPGNTTVWAGKSIRNIANSFYIGRRLQSPSQVWNGKIAWFCIWNVALTAAEVAAIGRGRTPWSVRPLSVIMRAPLDGLRSPDYFLLPRQGTALQFTVNGTVTRVPNSFPHAFESSEIEEVETQFIAPPPSNPWVEIAESAHNPALATQIYTDATAVNGTSYLYRVKAVDVSLNVSGASNEAGPATPVAAPPPPPQPGDVLEKPPMNVAQMRELFLTDADDLNGTRYPRQVVLKYLNLAKNDIVLEIDQVDENYFSKSTDLSVTSTVNDLEFDLPADFRKASLVERLVSGARPITGRLIDFSKRDRFSQLGATTQLALPVCYLRGRKLGVVAPRDAYTLRLWYSHQVTDLADDNDIPSDIPSDFHYLVVLQALKHAFPSEGGGFAPFTDEYARQLEMLKNSIKGRQRQEPRYVTLSEDDR